MRNSRRNPRWLGWFAFALTTVVLLSHYAWKYGLNVAPPTSGDEISYHMIAWNLSHEPALPRAASQRNSADSTIATSLVNCVNDHLPRSSWLPTDHLCFLSLSVD